MPNFNEDAYGIPELVLSLFALLIAGTLLVFMLAMANNSPTYTDSFGNTTTPITNSSQLLVNSTVSTGSSLIAPLVLIGAVVVTIAVIMAFGLLRRFT